MIALATASELYKRRGQILATILAFVITLVIGIIILLIILYLVRRYLCENYGTLIRRFIPNFCGQVKQKCTLETAERDCAPGQYCVDGFCENKCTKDADCNRQGLYCDRKQGKCYAADICTPEINTCREPYPICSSIYQSCVQCEGPDDCIKRGGSATDCVNGKCAEPKKCTTDKDCVNFKCGPNGYCLSQCSTDAQCQSGSKCDPVKKQCLPFQPPCGPECLPPNRCINNVCRLPDFYAPPVDAIRPDNIQAIAASLSGPQTFFVQDPPASGKYRPMTDDPVVENKMQLMEITNYSPFMVIIDYCIEYPNSGRSPVWQSAVIESNRQEPRTVTIGDLWNRNSRVDQLVFSFQLISESLYQVPVVLMSKDGRQEIAKGTFDGYNKARFFKAKDIFIQSFVIDGKLQCNLILVGQCFQDAECKDGTKCFANICRLPCNTTSECPPDYTCHSDGYCLRVPKSSDYVSLTNNVTFDSVVNVDGVTIPFLQSLQNNNVCGDASSNVKPAFLQLLPLSNDDTLVRPQQQQQEQCTMQYSNQPMGSIKIGNAVLTTTTPLFDGSMQQQQQQQHVTTNTSHADNSIKIAAAATTSSCLVNKDKEQQQQEQQQQQQTTAQCQIQPTGNIYFGNRFCGGLSRITIRNYTNQTLFLFFATETKVPFVIGEPSCTANDYLNNGCRYWIGPVIVQGKIPPDTISSKTIYIRDYCPVACAKFKAVRIFSNTKRSGLLAELPVTVKNAKSISSTQFNSSFTFDWIEGIDEDTWDVYTDCYPNNDTGCYQTIPGSSNTCPWANGSIYTIDASRNNC